MENLFLGKQTDKVISFEAYCRSQKEQKEEESTRRLTEGASAQKLRANLELLCLFLRAGVSVSLLFWLLGASIQRPFSRQGAKARKTFLSPQKKSCILSPHVVQFNPAQI